MSFSDNPLIATLGSAIGLGDTFADASLAAGNQAAAAAAPVVSPAAVPKTGASAKNVPEYKNRPYIPQNEGRGVRPGASAMGLPPEVGMMDPDTLQNPQVQHLLGQYGVDASNVHPNPNVFLTNPAAYNRHPVIANAIERGLEGIANYQPGVDTAGTISNVARSVLGANAMRAQAVNAQVMAPFQSAQAVGALQTNQLQQRNLESEMQSRSQMQQHYANQDATNEFYKNELIRQRDEHNANQMEIAKGKADPYTNLANSLVQNNLQAWADKNGKDVSEIPPDVEASIREDAATRASMAKAAGANAGRKITANASTTNAGIRAGATVNAAGIRAATAGGGTGNNSNKQVQGEIKQHQSAISKMDSHGAGTVFVDPDTGKFLNPGSARWNAVRKSHVDRINQLSGGQSPQTQTAPVQAPSSSGGNPFRQ